jgi:hypothetical protein
MAEPMNKANISALLDNMQETITEAYERDPTPIDWLAVAEAAKERAAALAAANEPAAAPEQPAAKCARTAEMPAAQVADAVEVNQAVAAVKEALAGVHVALPKDIQVIAIVRKKMSEDYGSSVFHGTVLATSDYVLTGPADWYCDWCKMTYDESLSTTAVGSVYHASEDNARIIDAAYKTRGAAA